MAWGWHIDAFCDHLEAVFDGRILNIYIATPPGSTKSLTANVFFPAWAWTFAPGTRFLCAANAQDLAVRDSVFCRYVIESDWYQEQWGGLFQLATDQNVKTWFSNDKRGHRAITTVGSRTTGRKGDILILDDPHDTKKVESAADRHSTLTWFDRSYYNRVNNPKTGRRIVIGQRTHYDDVPGHVIRRKNFQELRIPEEYESSRPCRTSIGWTDPRTTEGELLRPTRFGQEQKAEALETLGSFGYAAQHQQQPVPAEGGYFKKAWFRHYAGTPGAFMLLAGRVVDPKACRRFITVDLAASQKTRADYTVIALWADDRQGNLILRHLDRRRLEGPDIVPAIAKAAADWEPVFVGIESAGYQLTTVQEARRKGLPVRELQPRPREDKVARSLSAQVRMQAGQVWFPESAPWLAAFEEELLLFDSGPHDDQVDVLSWACQEMVSLYQRGGFIPRSMGGGLGQ